MSVRAYPKPLETHSPATPLELFRLHHPLSEPRCYPLIQAGPLHQKVHHHQSYRANGTHSHDPQRQKVVALAQVTAGVHDERNEIEVNPRQER